MAMVAKSWSVSALSVELRRDRRLIAKAISDESLEPVDKKSKILRYKMADIVSALYQNAGLDLEQERAQLAQEQTRRLKRENDEAERRLIGFDEIVDLLQNGAKQAVSILEALPLNIKRRVPTLTARDIEFIKLEIAKSRNAIAGIRVKE